MSNKIFFGFFLLLLICLQSFLLNAQVISLDPQVRTGRLPNGFTYFIRKNENLADKVELRFVVKAGTYFEDEDQLGLAHLLEHMAFNGTKHYPGSAVMDYFNSVGFKPGNDWNAATGGDNTNYYIKVPIGNAELFTNALQILRDWAQDMTLDEKEIDDERGVVLEELRKGNTSSWRVQEDINAQILNHPKYSADATARQAKSINTFKYESLIRFYKDWYRPDLEAVIIVGNINVDETEKKIKTLFGDMKMPENPRRVEDFAARYSVPLKGKKSLITTVNKEKATTSIEIYQERKMAYRAINTVENFRASIIDKLYNDMARQRFDRLAEKYDKPFIHASHSIPSVVFNPSAQIDALRTYIELGKSQPYEPAMATAIGELNRIARDGFLPAEFSQAIDNLILENKNNSSNKFTSSQIAQNLEAYFVSGAAGAAPEQEIALTEKLLKDIMLEEVNNIAFSWINDQSNTTVVIISPDNKDTKFLAEKTVFQWIATAKKSQLKPYILPESIATLIKPEQIPVIDKTEVVKKETTYDDLEIKELEFINGLKVVLKYQEKGSTNNMISLRGFRSGGTWKYKGSDYYNAANVNMLSHNGVANFDPFQLEKFLDSHELWLQPGMNKYAATFSGACKPEDIELLLQLLHLQMTSPRKDPEAYNAWMKKAKESLLSKTAATNAFNDSVALWRVFNPDRAEKGLTAEGLSKVSLERIYTIYREEFTNPTGFTFVLSGNYDEKQLENLLVKYLGTLKGKEVEVRPSLQAPTVFASKVKRNFYLGDNHNAEVQLCFPGSCVYTLKNNLLLEMLQQALEIRMWERLREKEGGTYGVIVGIYKTNPEVNYDFSISFICATDNVDHMIAAACEELNRLKNEGFDDEMLAQVKKQLSQKQESDLTHPQFWTQYLNDKLMNSEDLNELLKKIGLLEIISKQMVNKAAHEYLNVETMSRFVLFPESMKPKK